MLFKPTDFQLFQIPICLSCAISGMLIYKSKKSILLKMSKTERKNSGSVFQIHTRHETRNIVSPDPTLLEFHQGRAKEECEATNCQPDSLVFDQDSQNMFSLKSVGNKIELSEYQAGANSVSTPIQQVNENVTQVNEESKDFADVAYLSNSVTVKDTGHDDKQKSDFLETENENKRIDYSTPKIFQENPIIDVQRLSDEEMKANAQVMDGGWYA